MTEPLGVGIIGCGNISDTYLRLAPLFRGIEVRACADRVEAAAQARAQEFGVRAMSVDALLASDDIAVIVNLTIPEAHFEVSRTALEAGKHVYSEKPFVLSVEDGLRLKAMADEKNLRVGSAPDTFLGGVHQLARQLIDEGAVGRITSGTAHVMSRGMESWHPNPDFFFLPGAGPVLDVGPYYVANLINLIGPVKRVAALANTARPTRTIGAAGPRQGETIPVRTPTTIQAVLEFASGAVVTLGASWDVLAHRHGHMELYGSEGTLYLPDPNWFGGVLEVTSADGTTRTPGHADHPFSLPNHGKPEPTLANYRTAGLADMALAIIEGREARCGLEQALHGIEVMTSILKSAESGAFVDLQTTCSRPAPLDAEAARALLA